MTKEALYSMYITRRMSTTEIAASECIPVSRVRTELIRCGIPLRTPAEGVRNASSRGRLPSKRGIKRGQLKEETKEKIREARIRHAESNAKGFSLKPNGYVEITRGKDKGRMVHVVVMEAHIGRHLLDGEVVHHIDGNRSNNDINNLLLLTRSEHCRLHCLQRIEKGENLAAHLNKKH